MRTKNDHCVRRFGGTLGTLMRAALGDHWGTSPAGEMAEERMGWEEVDARINTSKKL